MRVVLRKPILVTLVETIKECQRRGKVIDRIELTNQEFTELRCNIESMVVDYGKVKTPLTRVAKQVKVDREEYHQSGDNLSGSHLLLNGVCCQTHSSYTATGTVEVYNGES